MNVLYWIRNNSVLRSAVMRRTRPMRAVAGKLMRRDNADVVTYRKMVTDNLNDSELYRAGKFWSRINSGHEQAILAGELKNLRSEYINRTFAGPDPQSRQCYRALLYLYLKHVRAIDLDGVLERAGQDPVEGGTLEQEVFDGKRLSLDFLQSVEEAILINNALKSTGKPEPSTILELGAGYGRLAYVCKQVWPDSTYIILDLPEALICAQSWLSRVLPKATTPYGDGIEEGKIATCLPHAIESIPDGSVDVFANIYSLAEMPKASIQNYLRHASRITNGVVLSKNRRVEHNRDDGEVNEVNVLIPKEWKEIERSTTTLYEDFTQITYSTNHQPAQP